jgi:hypothetical protein
MTFPPNADIPVLLVLLPVIQLLVLLFSSTGGNMDALQPQQSLQQQQQRNFVDIEHHGSTWALCGLYQCSPDSDAEDDDDEEDQDETLIRVNTCLHPETMFR